MGDTSIALSTIADDNAFVEVKAAYAKEMVTGFMKLNGVTVGAVANLSLIHISTDALNAFGEIYKKQTMASGVIPQITAVFGTCGGGLALFPALTDFTFMEEKKAKLFVNTPNALAGNEISKCDTSSAAFQSEEAGIVDFVGDEAAILGQIRDLVCMLPSNNEDDNSFVECADDLNRADASLANCVGEDVYKRQRRSTVFPQRPVRMIST